jgi:superfamily II DNA/RNA helicase
MSELEDFRKLGLSEEIILALRDHGFTMPTAIQSKTIPEILNGHDLLIQAQTGSGKTACFALPILQKLAKIPLAERTEILSLILTPTRELALQIAGALYRFGDYLEQPVSVLTVIGGESINQQTHALAAGVDVVVATPGRLLDLISQNILNINSIQFLVFDEADKILDLGFAAELDLILKELPQTRQNLFFSATFSEKVLEIIKRISIHPRKLEIENVTPTVLNISQRVIEVNRENRGMLLRHLIKSERWHNGLIFVSSKVAAHNLNEKLKKVGLNSGAIHGDLKQSERNKALSDFKNRKIDFLIATDVACRGLDIEKLALVVNFDLPRSAADYIHRIGRTGRAGESGLAVSFIGHEDMDHFKLIEARAAINLIREEIPGFELKGLAPTKPKGQAGVKGKRMSKKDKARAAANKNI